MKDDDFFPEEQDREEEEARRRDRAQMLTSLGSFFSALLGVGVILLTCYLLFSLLQWLKGDLADTFGAFLSWL